VIFLMKYLLPFFITFCLVSAVQADQYRSRVYLDLDQDVTENVSLSVSELEQKINTFQDDYSRSSAEQFLAKHYSQQKDYPKAIEYLENALSRAGTADNTRRDMLLQLGRLYLLQKDYANATKALQKALEIPGANSSETYVLLAQLHYKNKKYVESAASLDKALALDQNPPTDLLQSALGLFYSIGNYDKAAKMVQRLLERDINNTDLWQQWISIYLKAGKHKEALNVMSLAWEKGIPFRQQDVLLLMDLYAINKIPGRGARVLEEALATGRITADPVLNERLFKLWLQAGDRDKAEQALEKVAQRGGDRELQLHLAQLYSEKEQWQKMQDMVLKACTSPLPDNLVSRANLLLGVSQLKLDDTETARRSFINATFFGGEMDRANQWLNYMEAKPATEREKIGIAGPCYSLSSRSIFTESMPD